MKIVISAVSIIPSIGQNGVQVSMVEPQAPQLCVTPHDAVESLLTGWNGTDDLWVFAYGSLIWRPSFDWVERRCITLQGRPQFLVFVVTRSTWLARRARGGARPEPGWQLPRRGLLYCRPQCSTTFAALRAREMVTCA